MLLESSERTVYVWNRDAISNSIREHLETRDLTIAQLKKKYIEHFRRYSSQSNLKIYWGDNSTLIKPEASIQYISKTHLIIGIRENERMSYGFDLNRTRIREIVLGTVFVTGSVATGSGAVGGLITLLGKSLIDKILGPDNFLDCYTQLVEKAEYEALPNNNAELVVNLAFERALK